MPGHYRRANGHHDLQLEHPDRRAAPPAEYMIEGISGQQAPVVNAHMKKRVAEGWTLHTFGTSYLVWQK